jgi:hypothetical protein
MATVVLEEKKPLWQAIVSNAKTFVEGQQSLFDALWSKRYHLNRDSERLKRDLNQTL